MYRWERRRQYRDGPAGVCTAPPTPSSPTRGPAAAARGWRGGDVLRPRQPIIPEGESDFFNASVVNFEKGAQTGWHVHSSDQILVITVGNGIVANESEEHHVGVGDVVQIKAGENHWHGATANGYMGHITITSSDSTASR